MITLVDASTILGRLASGAGLSGLGLSHRDGRWDLRGFRFPAPRATEGPTVSGIHTATLDAPTELRDVRLADLDLSDATWNHLRLTDVVIENCVADGASLRDLRVWGSVVANCSFRGANLRNASMGGTPAGLRRRNTTWSLVDFTGADLTATAHHSELYVDCRFDGARLAAVDFSGSRHVRSRFAGKLQSLEFRATTIGRRIMRAPINEMDGVDFREAELYDCRFWGLGLEKAILPRGGHVVIAPKVQFAGKILEQVEGLGAPVELIDLRLAMEAVISEGPSEATARGIVHPMTLGQDERERDMAVRILREAGATCAD